MADGTAAVVVENEGSALAVLGPELESARAYAAESHAPRTREAYRWQWRTFAGWCAERELDALPAEPATLAAYVAHRAETGWKPASLALSLTAIRAAHRAAGHEPATNHPAVVATVKGIRRTHGTVQRRAAPVVVDELRAMVGALPGLAEGAPSLGALRDRALLVLGFAGAFRRSELVALDVADVAETAEGLVVTVRRSKTDQEGQGVRVGLPYGSNPATCPVRALRAWLDAAGIDEGPLFRAVNRHGGVGARLAAAEVARVVKRAAERAGLDASRYSGHSLRAGLATTAAAAGKGDRAIMAQGRWRGRGMVDRYVREASLFRDNAAAGVL
jgi:site-specific recombinase XerD